MPVPKALTGTYRQIAWKLRFTRDNGGSDTVSVRPRKGKRGPFLDDDEPTLVTFEADHAVNVEALLRQGAIVPYKKPAAKLTGKGKKGAGDGKARSE